MNTRLRDDEDVIRDSAANLQRGLETVGGWLYLTTHRLVFEAKASPSCACFINCPTTGSFGINLFAS